jgi:galactokinase
MDRFAGTSANNSVQRAIVSARSAFGGEWRPDRVAIAPGRIELLGNHVDYNGGPVLAAAIDRFIAVAARDEIGPPGTLRAVAADVQSEQLTSIDATTLGTWHNASPPPKWSDYLHGLLAAVAQRSESGTPRTLRLPSSAAIAGDVPIGFGVSSSAALCVALALAFVEGVASSEELVLLAQEAEHRAGTPCGTMDQSASVAGGVIAFNGADLTVENLSPSLGGLVFAVVDSGVERSLSTSSYPVRVAESRAALELAQQGLNIELPNLAALSKVQLAELDQRNLLPEMFLKRVRHVVEETDRVREGRQAITTGDWAHFGQLMTASGHSSATLYEISHPHVEELVAEARQIDGVLGARMMGGGEGGSVLILAARSAIAGLESSLRSGYFRRHGMEQRDELIHVCSFAPGAALFTASEIGALA